MFQWLREDVMEVDLPIQKAWDFYMDFSNWPKWQDQLDWCVLEGELKAGAKIRVGIKNKSSQGFLVVTEVSPYHECKYAVKSPLFTQETLCAFQEISPGRTRITLTLCAISIFVPLMKKMLLENVEKAHEKCIQAFAEAAETL